MTVIKYKKFLLPLGILVLPLIWAYYYGPSSELTLLSRAHYNALFVFTPCVGKIKTYEDTNIRLNYYEPPNILSNTAPFYIDPLHDNIVNDFVAATDVAEIGAMKSAFKFKTPNATDILSDKTRNTTQFKIKRGTATIKKMQGPNGYGAEYLYIQAKNGYLYRFALPVYPERMIDRSWIFPALYHSGLLTALFPDRFTDLMPPRGFLAWLFTPSADKQAYCSSQLMRASIELKD